MMRVKNSAIGILLGLSLFGTALAEAKPLHQWGVISLQAGNHGAPSAAAQTGAKPLHKMSANGLSGNDQNTAPITPAQTGTETLHGTHVDFTLDAGQLGMYGQANVSGDTLYFTPTGFKAQSSNGSGYELASGTLNIVMLAHDGWTFDSLGLIEKGDYLLLGAGSSADVTGQIMVFDLAAPLVDLNTIIAPSAALNLPGVPSRNWQAGSALDLSPLAGAHTVNLTVENLLLASTSSAASLALVEKTFVGITPSLSGAAPVPEPEAAILMLAGLGLVGFASNRQRRVIN